MDFQYYDLQVFLDELLQEVVILHEYTFSQGLIKKLGHEYVKKFYTTLVNSPQCRVILCLTPQKELAGFISYTMNKQDDGLICIRKEAIQLALARLFTFRLNPLTIFRAYLKSKRGRSVSDLPELMSIVVKEKFRGTGIGRKLVQFLEEDLIVRNYSNYCVFTDNEEGYNFYKKNSFITVFEFELAGVKSACFKKRMRVESIKTISEIHP